MMIVAALEHAMNRLVDWTTTCITERARGFDSPSSEDYLQAEAARLAFVEREAVKCPYCPTSDDVECVLNCDCERRAYFRQDLVEREAEEEVAEPYSVLNDEQLRRMNYISAAAHAAHQSPATTEGDAESASEFGPCECVCGCCLDGHHCDRPSCATLPQSPGTTEGDAESDPAGVSAADPTPPAPSVGRATWSFVSAIEMALDPSSTAGRQPRVDGEGLNGDSDIPSVAAVEAPTPGQFAAVAVREVLASSQACCRGHFRIEDARTETWSIDDWYDWREHISAEVQRRIDTAWRARQSRETLQ